MVGGGCRCSRTRFREVVSREQLTLYQEELPEIHRFDADLVGISVDSVWSHATFGRRLVLAFPLLADFHPKGAVSRAFGVFREGEGTSSRALFVLDARGPQNESPERRCDSDAGPARAE